MGRRRDPRTVMHLFDAPMSGTEDLVITPIFGFIVPFIVGVVSVYVLLIFKPEAIFTSDQMVSVNKLEKERELKRRGAVKLGDEPENRETRRKKGSANAA